MLIEREETATIVATVETLLTKEAGTIIVVAIPMTDTIGTMTPDVTTTIAEGVVIATTASPGQEAPLQTPSTMTPATETAGARSTTRGGR